MDLTLRVLKEMGWVEIDNISTQEELKAMAQLLGKIILHPNGSMVDLVRPKEEAIALKFSLSAKHGLGMFPFHTDTAFWSLPARYVLMKTEEFSDCATRVLPFDSIYDVMSANCREWLKRAVFIVQTPNTTFYTSVLFQLNGSAFVRYDPCCMVPVNNFAKYLTEELKGLFELAQVQDVRWTGKNAILIDNWRVLHGRQPVSADSLDRKLLRIYIGEK